MAEITWKNGTTYKKIVNGLGQKEIKIQVSYFLPDGTEGKMEKALKYTVIP